MRWATGHGWTTSSSTRRTSAGPTGRELTAAPRTLSGRSSTSHQPTRHRPSLRKRPAAGRPPSTLPEAISDHDDDRAGYPPRHRDDAPARRSSHGLSATAVSGPAAGAPGEGLAARPEAGSRRG